MTLRGGGGGGSRLSVIMTLTVGNMICESPLNTSLKSTGTRDELSITLYLQSEINFCSVRMPVNA